MNCVDFKSKERSSSVGLTSSNRSIIVQKKYSRKNVQYPKFDNNYGCS